MAEKLCELKKKGGGGGNTLTEYTVGAYRPSNGCALTAYISKSDIDIMGAKFVKAVGVTGTIISVIYQIDSGSEITTSDNTDIPLSSVATTIAVTILYNTTSGNKSKLVFT